MGFARAQPILRCEFVAPLKTTIGDRSQIASFNFPNNRVWEDSSSRHSGKAARRIAAVAVLGHSCFGAGGSPRPGHSWPLAFRRAGSLLSNIPAAFDVREY